jgi:hypothetical protein
MLARQALYHLISSTSPLLSLFFFCLFFELGSYFVAQAGLELLICCLSLPPKCCDYIIFHLLGGRMVLGFELWALCLLTI